MAEKRLAYRKWIKLHRNGIHVKHLKKKTCSFSLRRRFRQSTSSIFFCIFFTRCSSVERYILCIMYILLIIPIYVQEKEKKTTIVHYVSKLYQLSFRLETIVIIEQSYNVIYFSFLLNGFTMMNYSSFTKSITNPLLYYLAPYRRLYRFPRLRLWPLNLTTIVNNLLSYISLQFKNKVQYLI